MLDDVSGFLEESPNAFKVAINMSEILPVYDKELREVADKYDMEPITSELVLKETTYLFDSEESILYNVSIFSEMLFNLDGTTDKNLLKREEEYVDAVHGISEALVVDFSMLLQQLNVYKYLKENDQMCSLCKAVGNHLVYQYIENNSF